MQISLGNFVRSKVQYSTDGVGRLLRNGWVLNVDEPTDPGTPGF